MRFYNKKGFAIILVKPFLWLLYLLIVATFLIIFILADFGGSGRDSSRVSAEMPEYVTTIEALNYLRTTVEDTTVGDLLIKAVKRKDVYDKMDFQELEEKTNGLITIEDIELEEEDYTYEEAGKKLTGKEEHYTITLSINKQGNYRETQEVEFYLPSNLKEHAYFKIIMEIPYEEK